MTGKDRCIWRGFTCWDLEFWLGRYRYDIRPKTYGHCNDAMTSYTSLLDCRHF